MAVDVNRIKAVLPSLGTGDGDVIQFHLDAANALIPDSVPDDAKRDLAVVQLVALSLSPINVNYDGSGNGLTYRNQITERNRIIDELTPIPISSTLDSYRRIKDA